MLAILKGEGRGVKRYSVSDAIAADEWTLQQLVSSAWPRKFERNANARFLYNTEPLPPGCSPIERREDVSLAYCP